MTPEMLRRQLRRRGGGTGTLSLLPLSRAALTLPPALLYAHGKARLPGRGHGLHGNLSLLHLHPSELLPTLAGATR